ncbi:hypothetical protein BU26DRAFT_571035 [Trematosphaeria pertusa]|uniref:Uncharacterized protein n=1 Tax=Trematosphaeria pertusa TaxID=390896 RepID=A0A6A6HXM3_9PLEO|nr:uncharacterized protein BU26DRAFT_571035 [Trematosphaeria pertusa]KAF2242353.1 hypothetical protein BU26DRAFT_571035 [Trematosphaeria pertusa]
MKLTNPLITTFALSTCSLVAALPMQQPGVSAPSNPPNKTALLLSLADLYGIPSTDVNVNAAWLEERGGGVQRGREVVGKQFREVGKNTTNAADAAEFVGSGVAQGQVRDGTDVSASAGGEVEVEGKKERGWVTCLLMGLYEGC